MPVYNAPLLKIDPKETRRYAGLMRAKNFDETRIEDACQDARLLARPQGIWQLYDYDCEKQTVLSDPPFRIEGTKIGRHLAGCDKVILLAVTVGDDIEEMVTKRFADGEYTSSVLLDAAATTAVEQLADGLERAIKPKVAAQGYSMRWRFSPGYGDWPLEQQPELIRLTHCETIGISLSEAKMLGPRKSVTAIIGLYKEEKTTSPRENKHDAKGCAACSKHDCPARKQEEAAAAESEQKA